MKVFHSRYDWQDWCSSLGGSDPAEIPHVVYHDGAMYALGVFHGKTWRGALQAFSRAFKDCKPIRNCWQYAIREGLSCREHTGGDLFHSVGCAVSNADAWNGSAFDWRVERIGESEFLITLFLNGRFCNRNAKEV